MTTSKLIKIIVPSIFFTGIIVVGLILSVRRDSGDQVAQRETYSKLCNEDSIGEKIKSEFFEIPPARSPEIAPVIEQIIATQSHDKAVNCLFVLGRYHSNTDQVDKAIDYYDALLQVHADTNEWINGSISQLTPSDVEASRQSLKDFGGIQRQYIIDPDEVAE